MPRFINLKLKPEEIEQKEVIAYLKTHYPKVRCTISPNVKMSKFQRIKMWMLGYSKGTPDITVYKANDRYHGLCIELKAPEHIHISDEGKVSKVRDGEPTDEQREWLEYLNAEGYLAECCVGAREAIKVIDAYMLSAQK